MTVFASCQDDSAAGIPAYKDSVTTVKAAFSEITPEINSFGTITYYRKADVSVTTSGVIDAIYVEEGSSVARGQTLATINNIQLILQKKKTESQINQARAALELSQAKLKEGGLQVEARLISILIGELQLAQKKIELDDLERSLKNKEQVFAVGGMSEEAIHTVRMQYAAAKTQYELSIKQLEMQKVGLRDSDLAAAGYGIPTTQAERTRLLTVINTLILSAEVKVADASLAAAYTELEAVNQLLAETTIRSPVTGIIGMRYLELGERVQAEAKLFTVLDTSRVYAVFPVSEGESSLITESMSADITVDALGGKTFASRIDLISPIVDPQTGNITVKAILPNNLRTLKPGMFARVKVISGQPRKTILIPKTCIARKENTSGEIYTIVRGRVFAKKVRLGVEKEELIEIMEGLTEGDIVVDSPSPLLKEGQDVELKNET